MCAIQLPLEIRWSFFGLYDITEFCDSFLRLAYTLGATAIPWFFCWDNWACGLSGRCRMFWHAPGLTDGVNKRMLQRSSAETTANSLCDPLKLFCPYSSFLSACTVSWNDLYAAVRDQNSTFSFPLWNKMSE